MNTGLWWEDLRERDNLQDISVDERIILKYTLKKYDGMVWSEFICLRTETGGGLL